MKTRLLLLVFLVAGLLASAVSGLWMLLALIFSPHGTRAQRIAIAYDQLLNAATGGGEDETISSMTWTASYAASPSGAGNTHYLHWTSEAEL